MTGRTKRIAALIVASLMAAGVSANPYVLKSVAVGTTYDWDEPSNWEGGVVPPDGADVVISNDVENTTATKNTYVTINISRAVSVNSIKFHEMPGDSDAYGHGARVNGTTDAAKLTIGAGGLELIPFPGGAPTAFEGNRLGGAPIFDIPIELAASQTWHIPHRSTAIVSVHDGVYLNICKPLTAAAAIEWKVQGYGCLLFRENVTTGFLGSATFACDVTVTGDGRFGGTGSSVTMAQAVDAVGDGAAYNLSPLMRYSGTNGLAIHQDLTFAIPNYAMYFQTSVPEYYVMGDNEMTVSGTWTGQLVLTKDNVVYFASVYYPWGGFRTGSTYRIGALRKDTFKAVMRTDASAIPTKGTAGTSTCYPRFTIDNVTVVDGDNVLGPNNACSVYMRGRVVQGSVDGLLARDGRTVRSYITLTYRSIAGRTTEGIHYFGLDGPGECTFSGTIDLTQSFATGSRYCLTAPSNGVAQFTGKLAANCGAPYHQPWRNEIMGLGTVRLSGTFERNTNAYGVDRNHRSLRVRGGTLVLGNANAGGPHDQDLGVPVPNVMHVRVCLNAYTFADVNGWSAGTYSFKSAAKALATIDGVKLADGDKVLVAGGEYNNQQRNGVYQVDSVNKRWIRVDDLNTEAEFLPDLRIVVDEGDNFAGKAFYLDLRDNDPDYTNFTYHFSDGRSYQTNLWTKVGTYVKPFVLNTHIIPFHEESEPNPRVSLLIEDGITYTNTVNVWDNKSTGATTLGNWTNAVASCSFTGPVQLRRDVTLSANAGSSVAFSGAFTDLTTDGTNLVVSGGGTCDVSAATLDTKLALVFAGGTLNVTQSQLAAARGLSWQMAGGSTGRFAVTGSCDLSGLSLDLSFTAEASRDTSYVIGTASGGFIGAPTTTSLAKHWHLHNTGNTLEVRYWKPGLMFTIQ